MCGTFKIKIMKIKLSFFKVGLLLVSLVLTSCSPEDGADGAQGPQGVAGADGADGADGVDGNANVLSSDWFTPLDYTLSTGFGGINLLDHDEAAPEITQAILDTGVILVYGKLNGYVSTIWVEDDVSLLPIVVTYGTSPTQIDTWNAILTPGNVRIRFTNNNNTYTNLAINHSFRYVVVPEAVSSKSANLNYRKMSYEEVVDHFGLEY